MTPLAATAGGLLAGVAGTISMDAVWYLRQRRAGGGRSPLAWEFGAIESWGQAPAPGQAGKRLIEGFTQRELPDRWAWPVSTAMHWGYGAAWGAGYGIMAGSLRKPGPLLGVPFGAVVWASDYVSLPLAGLYEPIWKYDAKTLARDLAAHLAFGAGTGAAFWLFSKLR